MFGRGRAVLVGILLGATTAIGGLAVTISSSAYTANLYLATTGSSTCTRSVTKISYSAAVAGGHVCDKWQKAYVTAADGDTIGVKDGSWSPDTALGGSDRYIDSSTVHSIAITFECADTGSTDSVEHNSRGFYIVQAKGVTITGRCFRFKSLNLGEGSATGTPVQNITANNIRLETFVISGAKDVTIKNSNIGPSVACYAPSNAAVAASKRCQTGQVWPESWYFTNDVAADDLGNGQPQVRNNTAGSVPTGFIFTGNYVHDFQSRDSVGLHGGCFQSQSGGSLSWTISGNTFERCSSQGLLFDANGASYSDLTIENNFFGYAVENFDTSTPTGLCCQETATSQRDLSFKTVNTGQTMSNVLIRYNSFTHGLDIASDQIPTYSNVRILANIMGKSPVCRTGTGITYNRNVYPGSACGDASAVTAFTFDASNPYATYSEGSSQTQGWTPIGNFHLGTGPYSFENWITETTSDYALTTDWDGGARTSGSRDAGADER